MIIKLIDKQIIAFRYLGFFLFLFFFVPEAVSKLPNEMEFKELCRSNESEKLLLERLKKWLNVESNKNIMRWMNTPLSANNMMTPLHWLASYDHQVIAKYLLEHYKFDTNFQDISKWSPLFWAVVKNNKKMVSYLIKHDSVNINACDINNSTVLHYAARHGYVELVQLLLDMGANSQVINNQGHTPLDYATAALDSNPSEEESVGLHSVISLLTNPPSNSAYETGATGFTPIMNIVPSYTQSSL